jgi:hypothetical protein
MSKQPSWPAVALALLALSCGACASGSTTATAGSAPTSTAAATTSAATTSARPASPVEGTWRAGPLPMSVIAANLKTHRLKKWTATYLGKHTSRSKFIHTLKLQDGHLILLSTIDGVTQGVEDREDYTITGQHITFTPIGSGCASTFGWQVDGDRLVLTFVSDSCPPYNGTPDQVFMRALYASAPYLKITR